MWQARFQEQSVHDPLEIFQKGSMARVTWTPKFLGVKC